MEETFHNIEWERIQAAGIREEMLCTIRNLSSDNKEVRKQMLTDLFDRIWYQGTLSWSSAFAASFLIERLQQEQEPELLERILLHLVHLGTGSAYCDPQTDLSISQDRLNTTGFQMEREQELEGVNATYQVIYKGINIYLNLLENDSPNVRIAAAYTLTCCQPDADKICNRMYMWFRFEVDESVKVHLLLCLAILSNSTFVDPTFFQEVLNSQKSDLVKLSAAVSLADVAGKNISNEAVEILVYLLNKPNLFRTLYADYQSPMSTAHCLSIIDFLHRLNEQQKAKIIPVLIKVWGLPFCVDDLIYLAFGQQKILLGSTVYDLTQTQRLLLQAIADDNHTWNPTDKLVRPILNDLGIKGSQLREKLIRFINGERLKYE
ncbi:MAG: hypothetical protein VKL59_03060 [Nostocaceae cyanobacterium]|nr:hypothetical protein [Nostocaceae cyanobacterium]